MTTANHQDLLTRYAQTHSAEAFAHLVSAYRDFVYSACLRVLGNPSDAEDVTQECFIALAHKAGEVRTSLAGWLHARAVTLSLNRMEHETARRRREEQYASARSEQTSESTWDTVGPEVDKALSELPLDLREVVIGHYLLRKDQAQVAREMGISPPTVSRRVREGIELLRQMLAARGVVVSGAALATMLHEHGLTPSPAGLCAALDGIAPAVPSPVPSRRKYVVLAATLAGLLAVATIALTRPSNNTPPSPSQALAAPEQEQPVTESKRLVIEGVKKPVAGVLCTPFIGALWTCMDKLGDPMDGDDLLGMSGAAFRRPFRYHDPGNIDLIYFGLRPFEQAFWAAGYDYQIIPADKDAMLKAIKASLAKGRPVISFGMFDGPPEAGIIAGYDQDGEVLIGYGAYQGEGGYQTLPNWFERVMKNSQTPMIVIGDKKPTKPTQREILIRALEYAIDLERTAKRPELPEHVCGLAGMEAWASELETDSHYPADDKSTMENRLDIHMNQVMMLGERKAGGMFLRRMAGTAPEAQAELVAASDLFIRTAEFTGRLWPAGGNGKDGVLHAMSDPEIRRRLAEHVRDAAKLEEQAVTHLERALAALQPVASQQRPTSQGR